MTSVDRLKNTLAPIIALRKFGILRFTSTYLNVISISLNEPQVWCKLTNEIFEIYEIQSLRDNIISFEINIEQLFQVLKQYEKSNSNQLNIRLQKKENNIGKRYAILGLFFNDSTTTLSSISHTFNISIKLLKKENDERIIEPELTNLNLLMKLPEDINSLFKRIERYKSSEFLKIIGSNHGKLSLNIQQENLNVIMSWNEVITIKSEKESSIQEENYYVQIRLKDWRLSSKIFEVCKNMVLIISENEALVLHSYLDETESCQIIYFINAINL